MRYVADSAGGSVRYVVYDASGRELAARVIDQHRDTRSHQTAVIADSVALTNGAYVRAEDIPAGSNIDAVRFTWLPPTCANGSPWEVHYYNGVDPTGMPSGSQCVADPGGDWGTGSAHA